MANSNTNLEPVEKLCKLGTNIVGRTAAVTVGAAIAGLPGAYAGAVIGPVVSTLSDSAVDFLSRDISARQNQRIGAGLSFAVNRIWERLLAGDQIRQDDFFTSLEGETSQASQILEGVLIKCKNEYREKKIKLIGNIFANAAFLDIAPENVHSILRLAESLTYRQICVLGFHYTDSKNEKLGEILNTLSAAAQIPGDFGFFLRMELEELKTLKLIDFVHHDEKGFGIFTQPLGQMCDKLMNLALIEDSEFLTVFDKTGMEPLSGAMYRGPGKDKRKPPSSYRDITM